MKSQRAASVPNAQKACKHLEEKLTVVTANPLLYLFIASEILRKPAAPSAPDRLPLHDTAR
jgi:hypothetical protein